MDEKDIERLRQRADSLREKFAKIDERINGKKEEGMEQDETGVTSISRTRQTLSGSGVTDATAPEWSHIPLHGIRQFKVSGEGVLYGIAYTLPWQPGENIAECGHNPAVRSKQWGARPPSPFAALGGRLGVTPGFGYDRPHRLRDCSHGFYSLLDVGYFDGGVGAGGGRGYVAGLIEGYGEAIVGPDGFRCEKAKIVALVLPNATAALGTIAEEKEKAEQPPPARRLRGGIRHRLFGGEESPPRLVKWMQKHDTFVPLIFVGCVLGGAAAIVGGIAAPPLTLPLLSLVPPLAYIGWAAAASDFSMKWGIGSDYWRNTNWPSELLAALDANWHEPTERADIIAAYYDVPVYKTVEAMLERHPIERGEA